LLNTFTVLVVMNELVTGVTGASRKNDDVFTAYGETCETTGWNILYSSILDGASPTKSFWLACSNVSESESFGTELSFGSHSIDGVNSVSSFLTESGESRAWFVYWVFNLTPLLLVGCCFPPSIVVKGVGVMFCANISPPVDNNWEFMLNAVLSCEEGSVAPLTGVFCPFWGVWDVLGGVPTCLPPLSASLSVSVRVRLLIRAGGLPPAQTSPFVLFALPPRTFNLLGSNLWCTYRR
jgi:hypothetical protein